MKSKTLKTLALATAISVSLWGCGSNRDSGGDQSSLPGGIEAAQTVGVDNCLTCHSANVGQAWLAGVHGNPGTPAFPDAALTDPACLTCHDQLGDGQRLFAATNGAEANRPVVSCESCHGGGQYHRGVGPVPYVAPDHTRCGQCHNETYPHGSSPEGKGIMEAFAASPHIKSLNEAVFVAGTTDVRARCAKCHSDEGAKLYLGVDGDYASLKAALPDTAAALAGANSVQCRTCHKPHTENELLEAATAGRSSEFNTCTNCHQLATAGNEKIVAYHDPAANQYGQLGEIITDTHFATAGNWLGSDGGQNQNDIAGYAMSFADARVCRNCHNPHDANTAINNQWAASKHANRAAAGAWAHYNWTEASGNVRNDGSATSNRTACQRCHTTTGVIAYLVANADGNTADYVAPLAYSANYKPEMLHCNGCHTDSVGGLRATGRVTPGYTNDPFQYPDAGASNLCLVCHTGRESGGSIANDTDADGVRSFINSHYLTAGGTVYGASGYEYTGQSYANPSFYAHDKIGTTGAPGTGTRGPCIGCHLSSSESHSFEPVAKDAQGAVTAITSTVCASCHTGQFPLTAAGLEEEKEHFQSALEALRLQLAAKGIHFFNAHPYFYNAANGAGGAFTNWAEPYGLANYKNTMGAAFNYNLLEHDPGAYAHNRFYAKRLIFDAIDFLDNGAVDGTTGAAIDALVAGGSLAAAEADVAKAYLDGSSTTAGVQRP